MTDKEKALFGIIMPILAGAADAVLPEEISQTQWQLLCQKLGEEFAARLHDDPRLEVLLRQGDLKDAKGKINTQGIIAALGELRDQHQGKPKFGVLKHLADHVQHTLKSI